MISARRQIDAVLKYLYDTKDTARAVDIEIIKADKELLKTAGNELELERMILELKQDKYLQMYPDYPRFPDGKQDMRNGLLTYCSITFEGRLFWEDGGYTQQKINEDADKTRLESIETYQLSLSKKLNIVTAWIAGGTIALVLIELWKMALEHHWPFCY